MRRVVFLFLIIISTIGCQQTDEPLDFTMLTNLPKDKGGQHLAFPYLSTDAPFGHYVYLPSSYNDVASARYPLLIFLHGSGESGNSSSDKDRLKLVLRNGPPKMIEAKTWKPTYPMIVVSPQSHYNGWKANDIDLLIKYIVAHYPINETRIYLTGLSMGGFGTFTYLTERGNLGRVAAAIAICGGGNLSKVSACSKIPIWVFHGDADNTVPMSNSVNFVEAYNNQTPVAVRKAKLTIYPNVGHDSWTKTYDGSGKGSERKDYDIFNESIYDWMFKYQK